MEITRTALITGSTHGIGAATAVALAAEGYTVIICGRDKDAATEVQRETEKYGRVCPVILQDVLSEHASEKILDEIKDLNVSILINNVGGGGRWGSHSFMNTLPMVWDDVYQKNIGIAQQLTRGLIPNMIKNKFGRIITISSIYAFDIQGKPWFTMAKAAEAIFMKAMSKDRDLVRAGITFNTIAPGNILTKDTGWDIIRKEDPDKYAALEELHPMGHYGSPQDVAHVITFLCSDKAAFINGAYIAIDGGESNVI